MFRHGYPIFHAALGLVVRVVCWRRHFVDGGASSQYTEGKMKNSARFVVHVRKAKFDVYIGRVCAEFPQSKWANPFKIGPDGNRREVITKYHKWILTRPDLLCALEELKGKVLGCWCKPDECHGDVLSMLANKTPEELNGVIVCHNMNLFTK